MHRHTRPAAGLFLLIVLVALAFGCRQDVPPLYRRNQPPETTLSIVPEDSAQAFYRYHVYWRGADTDGRVVRYMFAITDTLSRTEEENWNPEIAEDRDKGVYTAKTDSVFTFNSGRGRQAFNITAIDDYGKRDPTPARGFFRIVDNGLPRVQFLDVQGFRDSMGHRLTLPACAGDSCVIPMFTNFKIRFTGSTGNNQIIGVQWQSIRPGEVSPEAFQPYGADSLFLATGQNTQAVVDGDTLWTLRGQVLTAFYYSNRTDSVPPGSFVFRARVRDEARLVSLLSTGTRRVKVNLDPQTHLLRIPACDCPNPPPQCASHDSVPAGWIVGMDQTAIADSSQWIRFCNGDTLPQRAWVRFYSRGSDDGRDVPIDPAGLREVGYSARFEWSAGIPPNEIINGNMPFSSEYRAADYLVPPPDNRPWRGFRNGWGDPEQFKGLCPFDFTYYVAAVDEHGTRDGSSDHVSFYVSGSPVIDSLQVPAVVVLVPKCAPGFDAFCPAVSTPFGADTVAVVGQYMVDPSGIAVLGLNKYRLAFRAWGHDHPRDLDPLIDPSRQGRILSWNYSFNCTAANCQDLALSGEGQWRYDTFDPDVFDDTLQVTFPLDTLHTTTGQIPYMAVLPTTNLGSYQFQLQGRDTDPIGGTCVEPSDLGPSPSEFQRSTSEQGRPTQVLARSTVLRQMQEVRPYVNRPLAARQPPKKGWWRR